MIDMYFQECPIKYWPLYLRLFRDSMPICATSAYGCAFIACSWHKRTAMQRATIKPKSSTHS